MEIHQDTAKIITLPNVTETLSAFDAILAQCRSLFEAKNRDYGNAWRILRIPSLTDQIFIKASRIRSIQEKKAQRVRDGINEEYLGIINYCLMALMQLDEQTEDAPDPAVVTKSEVPEWSATAQASIPDTLKAYDRQTALNKTLLSDKNHDYGEAWRSMRDTSFTDLILMKLLRIKQIEDNGGLTSISEGVGPGYRDIINYSVFALIQRGLEPNS